MYPRDSLLNVRHSYADSISEEDSYHSSEVSETYGSESRDDDSLSSS